MVIVSRLFSMLCVELRHDRCIAELRHERPALVRPNLYGRERDTIHSRETTRERTRVDNE